MYCYWGYYCWFCRWSYLPTCTGTHYAMPVIKLWQSPRWVACCEHSLSTAVSFGEGHFGLQRSFFTLPAWRSITVAFHLPAQLITHIYNGRAWRTARIIIAASKAILQCHAVSWFTLHPALFTFRTFVLTRLWMHARIHALHKCTRIHIYYSHFKSDTFQFSAMQIGHYLIALQNI